jgi:predicted transcriptional regulator of viral defense system
MKKSKKDLVLMLAGRKGLINADDVAKLGVPREYLSRLAREGKLIAESRGLYRLRGREPDGYETLIEVSKRVPKGVVALLSALRFHELTTVNPAEIWLAVENKSWIPKIEYPPVRFVYFSADALRYGVERHVIDGVTIPIFNVAKTVVDSFKYRNKIGLDVALEALREGWHNKRFRMDELQEYADVCRVKNVIRPYLESLV